MLEKKWIIETVTKLYSDRRASALYLELTESNSDILVWFKNDEMYLRAVIEGYYRLKFLYKKQTDFEIFLKEFNVQFLTDLRDNCKIFKAIDIYIYLTQRDKRNDFIFETLFKPFNYEPLIKQHHFFDTCKFVEYLSFLKPRKVSEEVDKEYLFAILTAKKILETK